MQEESNLDTPIRKYFSSPSESNQNNQNFFRNIPSFN